MHSPRLFRCTVLGLGLAVTLAACGSSSTSSPPGPGGSVSSTGGTASGGASSGSTTGSGGAASGGILGLGGTLSGGTTGAGGNTSGGATGSGGNSIGGSVGSGAGGATAGSGGASKAETGGGGGASSSGGIEGTGGDGGSTVATGGYGAGGNGAGGGHTGGADASSAGGAMGDAGGGSGSGSFSLTSPDLAEGAHFDAKFTCASTAGTVGQLGNGVNPELDWSGAPAGTQSFTITFIDTTLGDTNPMGQHWAIWNIPATVTKFPQATATLTGDLATAKQSGKFLTPCAQSLTNNMDDQYELTVYALSTATLNVSGTSVANCLTALKAVTPLGTAKLHGHAGLKGK